MLTADHVFIAVILLIVLCRFLNNYRSGFNTVLFFLVWLPSELRIEAGGSLPAFTIHRLLLMLLALFWLATRPRFTALPRCSVLPLACAMAIFQFISASLSSQPLLGFKSWLSLTCEMFVLYLIAATSMASEEQVMDALRAITAGLFIVAALTFVQYFTQFNIVNNVLGTNRPTDGALEDIQTTYPNRILLGYAMVLGWVLTFGRLCETRRTWVLFGSSSVFVAACYMAASRGPWLGLLIAGTIFALIGTSRIRWSLAKIVIVCLLCMVSMPDARSKIVGLAEATLDPNSEKGKSYEHRWKLWEVAYNEISQSPVRLLFGYGGNSTMSMDLDRYLEVGATTDMGFTSWDNQLASDLIEYGVVGFSVICCVLLVVVRRAWRLCNGVKGDRRQLSASLLTFVVVFGFAMTNVAIFAPQLTYLFWLVVAMIDVLERSRFTERVQAVSLDRSEQGVVHVFAS